MPSGGRNPRGNAHPVFLGMRTVEEMLRIDSRYCRDPGVGAAQHARPPGGIVSHGAHQLAQCYTINSGKREEKEVPIPRTFASW